MEVTTSMNPNDHDDAASKNARRAVHSIVKRYGIPVVVGINRFGADTDAELAAIVEAARAEGVTAVVCTHYAEGSKGAEELARHVVRLAESGAAQFAPLYHDDLPLLAHYFVERYAAEFGLRTAGIDARQDLGFSATHR
jgi:formyltetrahydrofolate synthetase